MRTTVEMKEEHRSALIALAAQRGQKGFSAVLEEAIGVYLEGEKQRLEKKRILRSLAGKISKEDAHALRLSTSALRESWR